MIKLQLPLSQIMVNQPFGANFVNFYTSMGLKGHNGIDFKAKNGFDCHAATSGTVIIAGTYSDGGIGIEIWDKKQRVRTIYYHLLDVKVAQGDYVEAGQIIGRCDNTGKYTTGDHLHFGLKQVDDKGNTLNYDNGYKGAIDPAPYFPPNWNKSRAFNRYGHTKDWPAEFRIRFKTPWIHKQLIKINRLPLSLTSEEVNGLVYGSWDWDIVINPAMFELWAFITKGEYMNGKKQFQ